MGKPKRIGRPRLSHWGMTQLYMRLVTYMQITFPKTKNGKIKSKLTSWNAYQKLVESKHWEGIVKQIYKRSKNKELYIDRLLNPTGAESDSEGRTKKYWCDRFYIRNVNRRGKDTTINFLFNKLGKHTYRKNRSGTKELLITKRKPL